MSRKLKYLLASLSLICLSLLILFISRYRSHSLINPLGTQSQPSTLPVKPLANYDFPALMTYTPNASQILLSETLALEPKFTAYRFAFETEGKTMTGQLNIPNTATPSGGFPMVLMIRGFVDPAIYTTGIGTKNAAAAFAKNGYVTLAPDFLGFGGSDPPNPDLMGERLEKPLNLLDLIASVPTLSFVNPQKLFIWAHSNGGQIALSLLEITGKPIPTTLWAPVSKPFPYSILYYTDEAEDQGKALRQNLAEFESQYDVYNYSIDRFLDQIKAPIQIHQGTADEAVPLSWSQTLVDTLQSLKIDITFFIYPGADHNLKPSWDTAIARDLIFFNSYTKE